MTATVISFANQKGGTGKTTTCHNLSVQFAKLNKKTLVIDIDGQGNITTLFSYDINELNKTISNLLIDNKLNIQDIILKTNIKNLDLIPSNRNTYFAEKELTNKSAREFILSDSLDSIKKYYDFILIDTPPNLGLLTFSSLIASNYILLITNSNELSLNGIADIIDTIEEIQENKRININNTQILGVVHNDVKISNKRINRYAEEELNKAIKSGLIPKVFPFIRSTTEIENAQKQHLSIFDYLKKHKVIDDYKKLAKEVLKCLD